MGKKEFQAGGGMMPLGRTRLTGVVALIADSIGIISGLADSVGSSAVASAVLAVAVSPAVELVRPSL